MKTILFYCHDPMCSWCWGFAPVWQQLQLSLQPTDIEIRYLLGGLAADCNEPMPAAMQAMIRDTWRHIQQEIPGTRFNFDFWTKNRPRRSTYPACRAVIAARNQNDATAPDYDKKMLLAIQQAYYLYAENPSDDAVLVTLAERLALNRERFTADLNSPATQAVLDAEIQCCHSLGASGFPSLILQIGEDTFPLEINYTQGDKILSQIERLRNSG